MIKGSQLHEQAIAQIYKLEKILPRQGQVLSSDGYPLSLDYSYYRLALYKPNFQTDLDTILQEITNIKPEFATQNAKLLENSENQIKNGWNFWENLPLQKKSISHHQWH